MNYLALTQQTANWFLSRADYLSAVQSALPRLPACAQLSKTVLSIGPLRIAAQKDRGVIVVWNVEYLDATGGDLWGFIRLSHPFGLLDQQDLGSEIVFERYLQIINTRLQHLNLPDAFILRHYPNNIRTCLAGRGTEARQYSIAYYDGDVTTNGSRRNAVLCGGPWHGNAKTPTDDTKPLTNYLASDVQNLASLVNIADSLLTTAVQRPPLETSTFPDLEIAFGARARRRESVGPVYAPPALTETIDSHEAFKAESLTYHEWVANSGPLTAEQRLILESDALLQQPIRIMGPAGSGKTLLMQLLALRMLERAKDSNQPCRVLYVVHNTAMSESVFLRFVNLGAEEYLDSTKPQKLNVETLFGFSFSEMKGEDIPVIDPDAQETKRFQLNVVHEALVRTLAENSDDLPSCPLLGQVATNPELVRVFCDLIVTEIGIGIKGHGLTASRDRYIAAEQPLSKLHRILTQRERAIIFDVFLKYHHLVYDESSLLDSDDLAITLLSRLRTPLWGLKRKSQGFDFLFVDETQLFNENERRVFPLLTKAESGNLRIALALDEAQDIRGATSSGFGLLGIEAIANEQLRIIYRSTNAILLLAFHMIQQTTDLFGNDFPDFTHDSMTIVPDSDRRASPPIIVTGGANGSIAKFVAKRVEQLRKTLRQIAVVVHGEKYWTEIKEEFERLGKDKKWPVYVIERRGQAIDKSGPLIAISSPRMVGGQEFDAVVAVGLEHGVVPPRVEGSESLSAAIEQQALSRNLSLFYKGKIPTRRGKSGDIDAVAAIKNRI